MDLGKRGHKSITPFLSSRFLNWQISSKVCLFWKKTYPKPRPWFVPHHPELNRSPPLAKTSQTLVATLDGTKTIPCILTSRMIPLMVEIQWRENFHIFYEDCFFPIKHIWFAASLVKSCDTYLVHVVDIPHHIHPYPT